MDNSREEPADRCALQANPPQAPPTEPAGAAFGEMIFDRLGFIEVMVHETLAI